MKLRAIKALSYYFFYYFLQLPPYCTETLVKLGVLKEI